MPKNTLRRLLLAKRKALTASEIEAASRAIQEQFLTSSEYARSRILALYVPIHNEAGTDAIFAAAVNAAKTVLYPAVVGESLEFRRVDHLRDLRRGAFGIPEPLDSCDVIDQCMADLIVIPGVGFDLKGKRVGYGKGFYDKFLSELPKKVEKIGIAFSIQELEEIPRMPHDILLDTIITEKIILSI